MLPKETVNNPQALDVLLNEMRIAYENDKVPMTEQQTRMCVSIMMADDFTIDRMYDDFEQHWHPAGFFSRCNMLPIKYEKRLLIWLYALYSDFGIGGLILIAYYVQWFFAMKKWSPSMKLGLNNATQHCFPFGVFTKQTVHEFWGKQKVKATPDNLIDWPTAGASFMAIERTEPITYKDHKY